MSKKSPLVFLNVSIDGDPAERMVFELFCDIAPKTAENFRALCTGEKGNSKKCGKPLHYKGSFFHRIVKGSMAQAGDLFKRDGSFGESIYGEKFPDLNVELEKGENKQRFGKDVYIPSFIYIDESPKHMHDRRGLLTMAIADQDARGSLFAITFDADHHLDRKSVVFGKLVEGEDILQKIENEGDEEGTPAVTVKIVNSGELLEDKRKGNKLKLGKDAISEGNNQEIRRKKHKKSSREKKRKRRRYSSSESDSSESDSSESDSDSDTSSVSESDFSTSSDAKYKKRKRSSKRRKYRHGKRREKHDKKKRHGKRSKRKSKRVSSTDSDSCSSEDNIVEVKHKNMAQKSDGREPPFSEGVTSAENHKILEDTEMVVREETEYPKENGDRQTNGVELITKPDRSADKPDIVDDHPGKSGSRSFSPKRSVSKSPSISPKRSVSKSMSISPKRSLSPKSVSRSISRSPVRRSSARNVSISRSPVRTRSNSRSISNIPHKPISKSISRSSTVSPAVRARYKSLSRTPPRKSSRSIKSVSKSPVRTGRRSLSRSPIRSSRRSINRSPGRARYGSRRRSPSRSPVRVHSRYKRRSYSRSPVISPRHKDKSSISPDRRSSSRSRSPDGSSKRIRRGRGFSDRFSYARRYRTPSPDRRYGRNDRDGYSSYRRRHRNSPRGRTPPRYNRSGGRSRSPLSRSPIRYRGRRHSPSPPLEGSRKRNSSPIVRDRRKSPPSRRSSRSPSTTSSSSPSPPRRASDSSKKGLVSYDEEGSPDSDRKAE